MSVRTRERFDADLSGVVHVLELAQAKGYGLQVDAIVRALELPRRRVLRALSHMEREGRARWRPLYNGRLAYRRLWRLIPKEPA